MAHYAAKAGNAEALVHVMDNYPDFGEEEFGSVSSGTTPVHLAAEKGHELSLTILFSKVPDANILDRHGRTPLHFAARNGHVQVVEYLLRNGANVDVHDKKTGRTPMHEAAENGHKACVSLLLEHTEDASVVDSPDSKGRTPLMLAAAKGLDNVIICLMQNG